jgi:hypothetical protein
VIQAGTVKFDFINFNFPRRFLTAVLFSTLLFVFAIHAQDKILQVSENVLIVDQVQDAEIFAFGKTVIVKNQAKGVLAFGGDVIVEGRIEGDVATIGGSIIQKENGYIGGDVIIFGGTYRHEAKEPLRAAGKQTIMYAGYEEELRGMMQNPAEIFSPDFSWSFLAQRILSVLFWFLISLALTTIAPGAVSRAVARFQLSSLKIAAIGVGGGLAATFGVLASLAFLPNYVGTIIGLMAFVILILAYVFGRVTLQVSLGKWLQKRFLRDYGQSESVAILLGALVLTVLLSIPYVWVLTVFAVWVSSLGIVLTARSSNNWQKI